MIIMKFRLMKEILLLAEAKEKQVLQKILKNKWSQDIQHKALH